MNRTVLASLALATCLLSGSAGATTFTFGGTLASGPATAGANGSAIAAALAIASTNPWSATFVVDGDSPFASFAPITAYTINLGAFSASGGAGDPDFNAALIKIPQMGNPGPETEFFLSAYNNFVPGVAGTERLLFSLSFQFPHGAHPGKPSIDPALYLGLGAPLLTVGFFDHPGTSSTTYTNVEALTHARSALTSATIGGGSFTGYVPEPATWTLMIGGFGLAGASLRRRRIYGPV